MKKNKIFIERQVTLNGMMTFSKLKTGERTLDFKCCEDVEADPFRAQFHVQMMCDGNIYMVQKPRRMKNKPLFRDDNASLSHGHDKRWYFCFSLDEEQLEQLPEKLTRQASAIAEKVLNELILNK